MHPAAVTNHHCIAYLGLGSPGVLPQSMGRELRLFVKRAYGMGGYLRRVDWWHFPFFSFFDTQPRNRQSRHVMLHGTVGIYTYLVDR